MKLRRLGAVALCMAAVAVSGPPVLAEEPEKPAAVSQKQQEKPKPPAAPKVDSRTAYNLGAKLMEKRDYRGALEQFNAAIAGNNAFVKAYVFRGVCYFMLDNAQKALNDLDKGLEFDPENPEGLFYRGQAYFFLGQSGAAIKDYDRFLTIYPENGPARFQKAMALYRLRDDQGCITEASRAIGANPKNADAFAVRGGAYWRKDMLGPARDDFQKASELEPDNPLFQLLSYLTRRLNEQDSKTELAAFYNQAPDTAAWPYPAIGMFLGKVTPPEVLKAGDSAPDQPYLKDLTEAQARFFVAWYFKLNGNDAKYREYMQAADAKAQLYMVQTLVKQRLEKLR